MGEAMTPQQLADELARIDKLDRLAKRAAERSTKRRIIRTCAMGR